MHEEAVPHALEALPSGAANAARAPASAAARFGRVGFEARDEALARLFISRGTPEHIRSDNGPEFCAEAVREWLDRLGVGPLFIEPGSPWENGYCESFNGGLRDEMLNGEIFYTLQEAQILIEGWRREYNEIRPHGSLGYRPPAPQTRMLIPAFASVGGGRLD